MKEHWHEQIQCYVAGGSTPEETAALQQALKDDAGLRALYLDYLNLDVALGAAAEAAITKNGTAIYPRPSAWSILHHWRWIAAAATCVALIVLTIFPRHHDSSRARRDLDATISSTQNAIARLSFEPASSLPGWMSPTASMLQLPKVTK